MKRVLLIFSDINESEFISANLQENGCETIVSSNILNAGSLIEKTNPDLVVINGAVNHTETKSLIAELKKLDIKSLILADQQTFLPDEFQSKGMHYIIRPLRPKLLLSIIRGILNAEEMDWLPVAHS
jgi:DNA-binding response OmpR family regulator